MKSFMFATALVAALAMSPAVSAQDASHAHAAAPAASKSQGSKLGACSKEAAAKGLKGAERNAYLSECGKKKD